MTRINAGIPPAELSDKHLLAEHREIKRIPNAVSKGKFNIDGKPEEFTLGKGHVKFFYDKLSYLFFRYRSIYHECLKRGFKITYYGSAWDGIPLEYMGDYIPTKKAIGLVRQRIKERS